MRRAIRTNRQNDQDDRDDSRKLCRRGVGSSEVAEETEECGTQGGTEHGDGTRESRNRTQMATTIEARPRYVGEDAEHPLH